MSLFKGSRECRRYSEIKNEEKRSKDYLTNLEGDQAISDEYLDDGSYRIVSANGDQMPFFPPGQMHCGTINPIWLNGIYNKKSSIVIPVVYLVRYLNYKYRYLCIYVIKLSS